MYLSINDLEHLAEFNLLQLEVFIIVYKNQFAAQTSDLLENLAIIFLYNFNRECSLLKLKIKKGFR